MGRVGSPQHLALRRDREEVDQDSRGIEHHVRGPRIPLVDG